jgi:hypothetical protein
MTAPRFLSPLRFRRPWFALGMTLLAATLSGPFLLGQGDPANLLAYDGFDYSPTAPADITAYGAAPILYGIYSSTGGTGWADDGWGFRNGLPGGKGGTNTRGTKAVAGSLRYGGLHTTGNHARVTAEAASVELARRLATTLAPSGDGPSNTRSYISFLALRTGPTTDPLGHDDPDTPGVEPYLYGSNLYPRGASLRFFKQSPSATEASEALAIGRFSNRTTNVWSLFTGLPEVESTVEFGRAFTGLGEVDFVVLRIDHNGGIADGDDLYLWINPDLYDPDNTATADIAVVGVLDGNRPIDFSDIIAVGPFVGDRSTGTHPGPDRQAGTEDDVEYVVREHAELLFDELRIGRTWASVTPFDPIPEIRGQPQSVSVPIGQPASFAVQAVGQSLTYQWKRGTTNVGTGATLNIASVSAGDAGTYTVTITNSFGTITSEAVTLTATDGPVGPAITTQPSGAALEEGGSATLSVVATGNTPLTYVWKKDGVVIDGAPNASVLQLTGLTSEDAGTYTVEISNSVGSVTSSGAVLSVAFAAVIVDQPLSVVGELGAPVTLSVNAEGLPLPSYQWYKDGVAIDGATGATLGIASLGVSDVGLYQVEVSNSPGGLLRITKSDKAGVTIRSAATRSSVMAMTGTDDVPVDAPITVTFSEPVQAGFAGFARLHLEDGTLVGSLDLSAETHTRSVAGENFNYLPILANGSTASITFREALAYGNTYYVTLDPGTIRDLAGNGLPGIDDPNVIRFTVRAEGPDSMTTRSVSVRPDGSGDFATLQGAFDFFTAGTETRTIHVANGHYQSQFFLPANRQNIRIFGESRQGVVFSYPNNSVLNESRQRPVMYLRGRNVELHSVTILNTTEDASLSTDALAIQAINARIRDVSLSGYRNTVRVDGTAYFENCTIEGNVDLVWGEGAAYFQSCTLHSLATGSLVNPQNIFEDGAYDRGFVFHQCVLSAEAGVSDVLLGQVDEVDYPGGEAVFLDCWIGSHVSPVGWALLGDPPAASTADLKLYEFGSRDLAGILLDTSARHAASRQLSAAEAAVYRDPYHLLGGVHAMLLVESGTRTLSWIAPEGVAIQIRHTADFNTWTVLKAATGTGLRVEEDISALTGTGARFFEIREIAAAE